MKVREIMVPIHGWLAPTDSIKHAARMMRETRRDEKSVGVRAMLVFDDDRKLIGMVSMGDILKAVFPKYLQFMDMGDFTWDGMVEDAAHKVEGLKVQDIMTSELITVWEDSPLMAAVDHMIKHGLKRLPVVTHAGEVLGIVYERDVFSAIVHQWETGKRKSEGSK